MIQEEARLNRHEAQLSYKNQYDKKASNQELHIGQNVLVKRTHGKYPKASVRWVYGPFTLVKKLGPVNWFVKDENTGKIKAYHCNLLQPAKEEHVTHRIPTHVPYDYNTVTSDNGIHILPVVNNTSQDIVGLDEPPVRMDTLTDTQNGDNLINVTQGGINRINVTPQPTRGTKTTRSGHIYSPYV